MHTYILYAHPGQQTFSRAVLNAFTDGLGDAGHTFEINDLYQTGFLSEMSAEQYEREVGLDPQTPVPDDVRNEQANIAKADALGFVYPVWWSDVPAKLKGWFDRVWTYGYAYFYDTAEQRHTRIHIEKAVVLCSAGHTADHLESTGIAKSMRRIMLNDRLLGIGIKKAEMEILGGMMPHDDSCRRHNLQRAYLAGKNL